MPRMTRTIDALFGYGWERDFNNDEFLTLIGHLPYDLSETDRNAARKLLTVLGDGGCNLDRHRRGVRVCREHLSPDMIGIDTIELRIVDEPPYQTGQVAEMLGIDVKQLRRLLRRVSDGMIPGVQAPPRSIGRTGSKNGWYVWNKEEVRDWHEKLISGAFNAFGRNEK